MAYRLPGHKQAIGTVYALCEDPPREMEKDRLFPASLEQVFIIKVGFTSGMDAEQRRKSCQTGNPRPLKLIRELVGTQADEREIHRILFRYRTCGEWFEVPGRLVRAFQDLDSSYASHVIHRLNELVWPKVESN